MQVTLGFVLQVLGLRANLWFRSEKDLGTLPLKVDGSEREA